MAPLPRAGQRRYKARDILRGNHQLLESLVSECEAVVVADNLEELVPDFCVSVPTDPFSETALNYKKTADGMMVYSNGTDGTDNATSKLAR